MLTKEQLAARRHAIGSSDAPSVVGVDPFKTAYETWASKALDLMPAAEDPSEALEIGNMVEEGLVAWAEREIGRPVLRGVSLSLLPGLPLACNLDGITEDRTVLVEAKSSSYDPGSFGEQQTDAVPDRIIVQVHQAMIVEPRIQLALVPVLTVHAGRLRRAMFRVERNNDLAEILLGKLVDFWHRYVETKTPPPLEGPPPLEILKRIRRQPGSVAIVPAELVNGWDEARQIRLAAEKEEQARFAAVLAEMGDAEAGDYGDASRLLTYFSQSRRDLDSKRLRAELPEIAAEYERTSEYRVARLAKR